MKSHATLNKYAGVGKRGEQCNFQGFISNSESRGIEVLREPEAL